MANLANALFLQCYAGATSLWWTAMLLTTMGSEYWPKTPEGRFLCLVLAVYGFTMFGYVTATLATLFVTSDALRAVPTAKRSDMKHQSNDQQQSLS